jgi:hypothetical protein
MLIGLVGRIGTDGFDFGMDEDYHSRTAVGTGTHLYGNGVYQDLPEFNR